jgi:succinoglycan biosynthesis protein ExoA
MDFARVACVMPFLNEARNLPDVLASLAAQDVDRERLFVVGVDNGSDDGSDAVFLDWLGRTGIAGSLVREQVPSIPRALNAGLRETTPEDVVVRLDAHTIYAPDYLRTILDAFASLPDDVWCVGGAPTPHLERADFERQLGIALYSNPLGLGPADFRRESASMREVTTVYLGAWRPGVLQRLGGFDDRWRANEDCELTERIRAHGGRIVRVPVRCGRKITRGALATVRQWSRYGFWRMQTFRRYPQAVRPRHLVPPLVLVGSLGLLATRYRSLLLPLYAAYALATVASRRRGEPALVTGGSLLFFPLVHVGYACGLLVGLLYRPSSLR